MVRLRSPFVASTMLALAACSEESGDYIRVGGGGFVFNYRIAEATAGIIAEPARTLPDGATIEARFENPAGGDAIVIAKPVTGERKRYSFSTPPLHGIEADRSYTVTVLLLGTDGKPLQTVDYAIRSDLDQSVLPEKPLTVGPGYHRNPETTDGQ